MLLPLLLAFYLDLWAIYNQWTRENSTWSFIRVDRIGTIWEPWSMLSSMLLNRANATRLEYHLEVLLVSLLLFQDSNVSRWKLILVNFVILHVFNSEAIIPFSWSLWNLLRIFNISDYSAYLFPLLRLMLDWRPWHWIASIVHVCSARFLYRIVFHYRHSIPIHNVVAWRRIGACRWWRLL